MSSITRDASTDGFMDRLAEAVDGLLALDPDTVTVDSVGELLEAVDRQVNRLHGLMFTLTISFEARGGPRRAGHTGAQAWLQKRLRHDPARAKTQVETARRLETDLCDTATALRNGDINMDHAHQIARSSAEADGDSALERQLLDAARRHDPRTVPLGGTAAGPAAQPWGRRGASEARLQTAGLLAATRCRWRDLVGAWTATPARSRVAHDDHRSAGRPAGP